jgi:polar amino acid transport system ATP-binding protein
MAILEVKKLAKQFGTLEVLRYISFSLEKGQSLAIIGSSGSGKTTLLRCLNFLEQPDDGFIAVNGNVLFDSESRSTYSDQEIRKKRLHFGLVFQSFNLFPQYTAIENIILAKKLLAKERPDYKQNKKAILDEIREYGVFLRSRMPIRISFPAGSSSV